MKKRIADQILRTVGLIILTLLTSNASHDQNNGCLIKIRTGEFVSVSEDGKELPYKVTRGETEQIETYNDGKSKIISKIVWTSDSSFTLTTTNKINAPGCDKVGAVAFVKVINCEGAIQVYQWSQEGCGTGTTRLRQIK